MRGSGDRSAIRYRGGLMLTDTDIEIVPFKAEHYMAMDLWPDDDLLRVLPDFEVGLRAAEIPGQSFTAMDGDRDRSRRYQTPLAGRG
jgi:hypothetical protein